MAPNATGRRPRTRALLLGGVALLAACSISRQREVEIGAVYAKQIDAELPVVRDPAVTGYLQRLGDSLATIADTRGLDWHFGLINWSDVNAFALPGGWVYVTRGLVERADSLEMLAGVLGHEISHVTRRHAVKQAEKAQKANVGLSIVCVLTGACESTLTQIGIEITGQAVFAKYSRDDEKEADEDGVRLVIRAGISPLGVPRMLQKLLDERKTHPGGVDAWFRSHPYEEERIAYTKVLIDRQFRDRPEMLAALTRDTPLYRDFRDRVGKLPPAQKAK
ncbi:MAG TPA: M48 family metallopeptidase [Gemmatimonadaceae bacterium]|nr:M48 family metallopeptidase [Gemmatimonadaceae bacterium]